MGWAWFAVGVLTGAVLLAAGTWLYVWMSGGTR